MASADPQVPDSIAAYCEARDADLARLAGLSAAELRDELRRRREAWSEAFDACNRDTLAAATTALRAAREAGARRGWWASRY